MPLLAILILWIFFFIFIPGQNEECLKVAELNHVEAKFINGTCYVKNDDEWIKR